MRWLPGTEILTCVVATRAPGYAHRHEVRRVARRPCPRAPMASVAPVDPPPPVGLVGPGDGGWVARLERWAAEARVDAAAEARAREHWLRRQAEEEASLAGVLADLADAEAPVRLHLRSGEPFAGTVRAVGADLVAVAADPTRGSVAVVSLAAVTSVRTGAGARAVTGDRAVVSSLRLADVLVGLAAAREAVRVVTLAGETVAGEACWVGQDVAMVRVASGGGATVYVPLAAVAAVVVGE